MKIYVHILFSECPISMIYDRMIPGAIKLDVDENVHVQPIC